MYSLKKLIKKCRRGGYYKYKVGSFLVDSRILFPSVKEYVTILNYRKKDGISYFLVKIGQSNERKVVNLFYFRNYIKVGEEKYSEEELKELREDLIDFM